MKLKFVNFSASNAKRSVKFASVNENSLHAALNNNNCLFTFWANSEWSFKQPTGLFAICCVYSSVFYSLMWMHIKIEIDRSSRPSHRLVPACHCHSIRRRVVPRFCFFFFFFFLNTHYISLHFVKISAIFSQHFFSQHFPTSYCIYWKILTIFSKFIKNSLIFTAFTKFFKGFLYH